MIPREADFTKEESSTTDDPKNLKPSSSSTTSWTRFKDPRIVRVSKALGGKDRHSKVCTVRGLRDRRVRLSIPTAIQLYDLQDRLGLSQPSKVVDWLLNAAKHEIDELPPLQIPPGAFSNSNNNPSFLQMMNPHEVRASQSDRHGLKVSNEGTSKDVFEETNEEAYVSSDNFPDSTQNPFSFLRWDPSNLTLCHPPRSHGFSPHQQPEDWHNFGLIPLQPAVSVPSGSHQVLVYQTGMSTQSYLPSQIGGPDTELGPKQLSFLGSPGDSTADQPVRPINFNMTANLLPSQDDDGS